MLETTDSIAFELLQEETKRQLIGLELIASENYVSSSVLEALGSVLTNKYSEGYPGKRYYGGNEVIDKIENLAKDRLRLLFGGEHHNVQPLSGSPANLAVFLGLLQTGDTILAMDLGSGGHLTHGHPLNFSGKTYKVIPYGVSLDSLQIDMLEVERLALENKPKMIIAGFSAYSRNLDWAGFRKIADKVGAILMVDMAHIAGLIAGKQLENPVPFADVVTSTTHKTLRGPRGAFIICKASLAAQIDRAVFPGVQGGPHDNVQLAKAVAFGEALTPSFEMYSKQVIVNARRLAEELISKGYKVITGGTDNHMFLVDMVASKNISGKEAQDLLESVGISTNKNMIPFDTRKPQDPSGLRLGTAAFTTRGGNTESVKVLADLIDKALSKQNDIESLRNEVIDFAKFLPLPN